MSNTSRLSRIARKGPPSWSAVRTVSFAFLLVLSAVLAPVQFGVSPVQNASALTNGVEGFEDGEASGWDASMSAVSSPVAIGSHAGNPGNTNHYDRDGTVTLNQYDGYLRMGEGNTDHTGIGWGKAPSGGGFDYFTQVFVDPYDNTLQAYDGSSPVNITTGISATKWYHVETYPDFSANTYDIVVKDIDGNTIASKSGLAFTVNMGSTEDVFATGPGYVDEISVTSTSTAYTRNVSGTVRNQNGDPVSNATVKAFGFDYANFTGTKAEIQEEIDGIVANISDPSPPDWNPNRQVTGPGGVLDTNGNNDTRVVLAHPQETYTQSYIRSGAVELRKDPTLRQDFSLIYSTSDTVTFTCWDPSADSLLQNDIDEDLAGKTTSCNLVIEKVGAGGETVTSTTAPTSPFIQTGNIVEQKEHHGYTMREPSAGFYRVYAEGHPETAVTYAVAPRGNINALANIIRENLKNQAGSLEDRANDLSNYQSDNKITSPTTTQTNETGQYSMEVNAAVEEVSLVAYKAPGSMNVDPNNPPTQSDIKGHFESEIDSLKSGDSSSAIEACKDASSTIGSGQAPAGITRASVPESGVTVNTVGSEIPNYADMSSQICYQADLLDFLRQNDLDGMLAWAQQNLDGMSIEEMRELRKDAWDIARGSESACHSVASRYGADAAGECSGGYSDDNGDGQLGSGSGVPTNGADASVDELKKQIKILQQTVDTMEETIDSETGETTTGNGTISKEWFFDTDLSQSNVIVKADYSNGTTTTMTANNSDYVSVNSRLGQSDTVSLTDYPLGTNDPAMVSFSVIVAGPDGVGRERSPVRNPTFNGNVPTLESIRLSKLSPGPDDRVQVRVTPEDQAKFGSLTDATVTAPDGSSVPTANISDGRETAFTTQSQGVHHVRLTFTNADGTEFVETVRVNAGSIRHDLPPTVRGETGPTGVFAVASGLESASIDIQAGGEVVRSNAIVGEKADVPASVDVHTTGLDVSSSSTTEFALVRGDTRKSIRRSVTVRFHGPDLGENPVLYREPEAGAQPLPRDGENLYGAVLANDTTTTIETYTTGDGTVSVLTDTDPSRFGRLVYRVRLQAPWIPALVAGVPMPGSGFAGGLSLALLGAGLALTHGRREL